MANITVSNLKTAGFDLFSDSESYLQDLDALEQNVRGGLMMISGTGCAFTFGAGIAGVFYAGVQIGAYTRKAYEDAIWEGGI
jgi:hypothetical protein